MAQETAVHDPSDLKAELWSETGTNRFQAGELIPLEVPLSVPEEL